MQAPNRPAPCKFKMADGAALKSVLEELNLPHVVTTNILTEKLDFLAITNLSDEELIKLGITALGDRTRLKIKCRQKLQEQNRGGAGSTETEGNAVSSVTRERALLFSPYGINNRRSRRRQTSQVYRGSNGCGRANANKKSCRTWTVNFVCLANPYQMNVPSHIEKERLQAAGLGYKKIKLNQDADEN